MTFALIFAIVTKLMYLKWTYVNINYNIIHIRQRHFYVYQLIASSIALYHREYWAPPYTPYPPRWNYEVSNSIARPNG